MDKTKKSCRFLSKINDRKDQGTVFDLFKFKDFSQGAGIFIVLTNFRKKRGRSEDIQLTKCELYYNHNLVNLKNFSGSTTVVAAGGSKQCVFSNLTKYSSSTGFAVYWYYTANGKSYIYRTAL